MRHPLLFVMGYAVIRIPRDDAARAVNALGAFGVSYRNFDFSGDFAYLECSFISMRRALRVLERAGISASVERRCGIPALIYRYRHR